MRDTIYQHTINIIMETPLAKNRFALHKRHLKNTKAL